LRIFAAHDAVAAGAISQKFADLYARSRIGEVVDFEIPMAAQRAAGRFAGKTLLRAAVALATAKSESAKRTTK
jgi:hypothetical protein